MKPGIVVPVPATLNNGSQMATDSPLDLLDISHLLVFKKTEEEGPDIRGGHPDALFIHATKANKNGKYVMYNVLPIFTNKSVFLPWTRKFQQTEKNYWS